MPHEKIEVFQRFLPEKSVLYCWQLWQEHSFNLKIKRKRNSKLGDYRYDPKNKSHSISVNNDLNPYSFLITYLHEIAHMVAFQNFSRKILPHGKEWKNEFKKLMLPMLRENIFPPEIQTALMQYMSNPKASSCSDVHLMQVLRKFDQPDGMVQLALLKTGEPFRLHNRDFIKEDLRRTRVLCKEIRSGKKFLISKIAIVKPLKEE